MNDIEISNYKQFWISIALILVGIIIILLDVFCFKTNSLFLASLGISFIASSIITIVNLALIEKTPKNPVDDWKITNIYLNRQEKDFEDNNNIARAKGKIDIIAFGLSSFRDKHKKGIEKFLTKSDNIIRILTMHPESPHLCERDNEENESVGHTQKTINDLIDMANIYNKDSQYKGKIIIKGYKCMTLDFYWKMGNKIYIGPYWYKKDSQNTITYKFEQGGRGFRVYSEYFEDLWNDDMLSEYLTEVHEE